MLSYDFQWLFCLWILVRVLGKCVSLCNQCQMYAWALSQQYKNGCIEMVVLVYGNKHTAKLGTALATV